MTFSNRLQIYLRERFPMGPYALLVLAFTLSAYSLAPLLALSHASLTLDWGSLAGFLTLFLVFLHLRIFDEFKDYEIDKKFHPNRPVPRGLISLDELRRLGIFVIGAEIALNLALGFPIFLFYLSILTYSLLMYKEFFIGHWLRNDRFVYALTHTPIMPLMGLYAYSLYLFRSGLELKYSVGFYLAICFFVGLAFEIARKVSAPEEERDETETYSKYFGTKGVVIVLVLLLLAITVCALLLGWFAHLTLYFFCGAILFFFFTVLGLWRFAHAPTPQNATRIGLYTSLYVLAIFLLMVFETLFTRGIAFG